MGSGSSPRSRHTKNQIKVRKQASKGHSASTKLLSKEKE